MRIRSLPPWWFAGSLAFGAALALGASWGCVDDRREVGPHPPFCTNGNCTTGAGIGLGTGGGGGETSGAGGSQSVSIDGTVVVTADQAFSTFSAYSQEATIHAPSLNGKTVTAPYGGVDGTTFSMAGLPSGLVWFLVQDETFGGAGVLSTYTRVELPSDSKISLPMVDSSILDSIATAVGTFVDATRAQVILRIQRSGAPLAGVSVTSIGNGFIAYDEGAGIYSAGATATGAAGIIVLLNVTPEGAGSTLSLKVTDGSKALALDPIPALAGGATLATIDL